MPKSQRNQPVSPDHPAVQIATWLVVIVTFGVFTVLGIKLIQWLWSLSVGCGV